LYDYALYYIIGVMKYQVIKGFIIGFLVCLFFIGLNSYAQIVEKISFPQDFIINYSEPVLSDIEKVIKLNSEKVFSNQMASKYAKLYDSCKNK